MTSWEDLLPFVFTHAHGVPDPMAVDHIIRAARDLCSRSLVWQYSALTIPSEAGKARYTLQLDDGRDLVRVLLVDVDGAIYHVPEGATGRFLARRGTGNLCTLIGTQDFSLSPAPAQDDLPIVTDIAVKPSLASTGWPDDMSEYAETVTAGAIASLCAMPDEQWSSPATSDIQGRKFSSRIATLSIKMSKGLGRSRQGSRVRMF